MMRPGPGQNYPRSGFPLEGKKGPQRRPDPGAAAGLLHSAPGLHWLLWRVQEPIPGVPPPQEGTVGRDPDSIFSGQTKRPSLLNSSRSLAVRPVPGPFRFALLFWKCRGGERISGF